MVVINLYGIPFIHPFFSSGYRPLKHETPLMLCSRVLRIP